MYYCSLQKELMTTATQQIPSNPALDFANAILEETNGALELIEILHDIAQGNDEEATAHDRITATRVLMDRGLGKCPRQITPSAGPNPEPAPETKACLEPAEEGRGACPEPRRRVTQIDDSLNQSLGPAPSACPEPVNGEPALSLSKGHSREKPALVPRHGGGNPESYGVSHSPDPFDTSSIQYVIQQHILTITNNGQTLRDTLKEIARAKDDPRTKPIHRTRAARILLDRILGTDPGLVRNGLCPDCRQSWTDHASPPDHPEPSPVVGQVEDLRSDEERWASIEATFNRMEEEGILTPDPNAPAIDIPMHRMPKDFDSTPFEKEEAAAFWAEIDLRIERQKQWPEIEERRRKKLAQIYPSHSDDEDKAPDT